MDMTELLTYCVKSGASDLHLSVGSAPLIRVDGELRRIDLPVLEHKAVLALLSEIMSAEQLNHLEEFSEIDFAFDLPDLARFRVNAFKQYRGASGAFRVIPTCIFTLAELGLPDIFSTIANLPRGLVLITGPTGSGKTTTLAAIIDSINNHRFGHILTIEDPVEFVHSSKQCLINQRQVHRDTQSFNTALRSALREDPDIIMVGELRDVETIRLALTAAETGHLVFASLHTASTAKTINRIIDVFPGAEKNTIRSQLAESLQAVVCQSLLPKIGGGRLAATEVMLCTPAIRNLIREDKIAQMYSTIQTSAAMGMKTLDQHLLELVAERKITCHSAQQIAVNKEQFTEYK